jgi:hypothetical protein
MASNRVSSMTSPLATSKAMRSSSIPTSSPQDDREGIVQIAQACARLARGNSAFDRDRLCAEQAAIEKIRNGELGELVGFTSCFGQKLDPDNHRAKPLGILNGAGLLAGDLERLFAQHMDARVQRRNGEFGRAIQDAERRSTAKLMTAYRLHFEPGTLAAIEKIRNVANWGCRDRWRRRYSPSAACRTRHRNRHARRRIS